MPRTSELSDKVLDINALVEKRRSSAFDAERVVHCHGCFDIVHPGHIRHLRHAAQLGDRLLVSITADSQIRKGVGRPLFDQALRAENLAALSFVDWVHICEEATAVALLDRVRPDVYVKGQEYESNDDPRFAAERASVERHGGRVVFSSGDLVFSSSALIDAMATGSRASDDGARNPAQTSLRRLQDRHELTGERLGALMADFSGKSVVVVGDVLEDVYTQCAWPEVARESPMLSLRPLDRTIFDGGAAIIARHLASLKARVSLVTTLTEDARSHAMRERLEAEGIAVLSAASTGSLPEKERLIVGRNKVVKLDRTGAISMDASARRAMIGLATDAADTADAAIVTDFGLGLLTHRTTTELFEALRSRVNVLAGDVSGSRDTLVCMKGADWLSPSEFELRAAVGDQSSSLPATAWELQSQTGARTLAVTLAEEGLVVFEPDETAPSDENWPRRLTSEHISSLADHAVDALGCGDALIAAATLVLAAGGSVIDAAYLGSIAAAAEASVMGNVAISAAELGRRLRLLDGPVLTVHRSATRSRIAG